jgi:hypothetical protein
MYHSTIVKLSKLQFNNRYFDLQCPSMQYSVSTVVFCFLNMKDCRDQDTPRVNSQKHVTRTWIDVFREIYFHVLTGFVVIKETDTPGGVRSQIRDTVNYQVVTLGRD